MSGESMHRRRVRAVAIAIALAWVSFAAWTHDHDPFGARIEAASPPATVHALSVDGCPACALAHAPALGAPCPAGPASESTGAPASPGTCAAFAGRDAAGAPVPRGPPPSI